MKKISAIALASCLAFITACSEKDVQYYQDNPNEAKSKLDECKEKVMKARAEKDKEAFDKIVNDTECKAADQVLKAIKKAEREQARAEREAKKKAEQEALDKADQEMLAKAEEKFAKEYGDMDWKAFQKVYKDHKCQKYSNFSIVRKKLSSEGAECQVVKKHYEDLITQAKNDFANQNFDELLKRKKEFCQLSTGYMSPCEVWKDSLDPSAQNTYKDTSYEALFSILKEKEYCKSIMDFKCTYIKNILRKKAEPLVKKYSNDDELFKITYTKCYEKSLTTKRQQYKSKGETLIDIDPICAVVEKAAVSERRLFELQNFRNPLE
ncbi:MAG: EexN family lipoprotein [Gammaproteobacteria bacterium]|nr:EexN family lipoprotein [Gammaproteobacteria bacterium]